MEIQRTTTPTEDCPSLCTACLFHTGNNGVVGQRWVPMGPDRSGCSAVGGAALDCNGFDCRLYDF
jgi:hypothetical protein